MHIYSTEILLLSFLGFTFGNAPKRSSNFKKIFFNYSWMLPLISACEHFVTRWFVFLFINQQSRRCGFFYIFFIWNHFLDIFTITKKHMACNAHNAGTTAASYFPISIWYDIDMFSNWKQNSFYTVRIFFLFSNFESQGMF